MTYAAGQFLDIVGSTHVIASISAVSLNKGADGQRTIFVDSTDPEILGVYRIKDEEIEKAWDRLCDFIRLVHQDKVAKASSAALVVKPSSPRRRSPTIREDPAADAQGEGGGDSVSVTSSSYSAAMTLQLCISNGMARGLIGEEVEATHSFLTLVRQALARQLGEHNAPPL